MTKVSPHDLKKNQNRYYRLGRRFMSRPPRSPWSFGELYGRPTRWARVFKSRLVGERIEEDQRRFRIELLDCISLSSTPFLNAMKKRP